MRARTLGLLAAQTLVLSALGCRAVPSHPRWEHRLDHGVVRAEDPAQADEVAALVRAALPSVQALPGTHRRPLVLHVVEQLPNELMDGATFHIVDLPDDAGNGSDTYPLEWIEICADALPRRRLSLIAHELTHFYLGEVWGVLPQVVEEGLAQLVSTQVDPRYGAEIRVENAVALATAISGGLTVEMPRPAEASAPADGEPELVPWWVSGEVDTSQLPTAREALALDANGMWTIEDAGSQRVLYGLGYLLASRIGVDGLYALCQRARAEGLERVPAEWLFEAAELDLEDPLLWKPAIRGLLGEQEHLVFVRRFDRRR